MNGSHGGLRKVLKCMARHQLNVFFSPVRDRRVAIGTISNVMNVVSQQIYIEVYAWDAWGFYQLAPCPANEKWIKICPKLEFSRLFLFTRQVFCSIIVEKLHLLKEEFHLKRRRWRLWANFFRIIDDYFFIIDSLRCSYVAEVDFVGSGLEF